MLFLVWCNNYSEADVHRNIVHRMWTWRRNANWNDRLALRPASEKEREKCRRPDQNRPRKSTESESSTRERRPSSISKLSCPIWSDSSRGFSYLGNNVLNWHLSNFLNYHHTSGSVVRCNLVGYTS